MFPSPQLNGFQLEVCVERVEDALTAARAGATRIELNSALECSGLTPSLASCRWVAEHCPVPVMAMVRPHDVGFCYTDVEKELMLQDCELFLAAGIPGIVSGALTQHGHIDSDFVSRLVAAVGDREFVFHRAFDQLADQLTGLEQLIDLGVARVLTSGGAATALAGAERLKALVERAGDRIEILPGAGIDSSNVHELVERVGCRQIHGSFRQTRLAAVVRKPGPDQDEIRAACKVLQRLRTS